MRIDTGLPQQLAVGRIDGVDVTTDVAKERGVLVRPGLCWCNHRSTAQTRLRLEGPVRAAAVGVDGVKEARIGANKQAAIDNGRLPVSRRRCRESESPFEYEPGYRGGLQSRCLRGLKPG